MAIGGDGYLQGWRRFAQETLVSLSATEIGGIGADLQKIVLMLSDYREEIHRYANVVGVGVSLKVTKFEVTTVPSISVFVSEKIPDRDRLGDQLIPAEYAGVPTDVVESGTPELRKFDQRIRPAQPGYSIGHHLITAGTFGCLVRDPKTEEHLILSNNHVLANSGNAAQGDPIVQPGPSDGGNHPKDTVASLRSSVPIVAGVNQVDAAVGTPTVPGIVTPQIAGGIGIPAGVRMINSVGDFVQKVGRTTQHTTGVVVAFGASVTLNYPGIGRATLVDSVVSTGMSQGGDSGALLLDMDKNGVGLLFAGLTLRGKEVITYHNDLTNVLNALSVELVTS